MTQVVTKESILALQKRIATIEKARQGYDRQVAVAEENCRTAIAALADLGVDVSKDSLEQLEDRYKSTESELGQLYDDLEELVTTAEKVIADNNGE